MMSELDKKEIIKELLDINNIFETLIIKIENKTDFAKKVNKNGKRTLQEHIRR